jgi:membrane protease YdiL (CAAX protease family)
MRPLRAWLIYLGSVLIGGALLAPWLHALAEVAAARFPSFEPVRLMPFHRFVNRAMMLVALAGLWPLTRHLGLRSLRDVGLTPPAGQWRRLASGFALGCGSLAALCALMVVSGLRRMALDHPAADYLTQFASAALAAALVGLTEETLFRGAVFGALRKECPLVVALWVSAAIYALVHFFAPVRWTAPLDWSSGFRVLGGMCRGFLEWKALVPGFVNLTLAGVLLAQSYQWTGSLYLPVGLHAGWVFWLKSHGFLTQPASEVNTALWGSEKLIDGWGGLVVLCLTFWVLKRMTRTQSIGVK